MCFINNLETIERNHTKENVPYLAKLDQVNNVHIEAAKFPALAELA